MQMMIAGACHGQHHHVSDEVTHLHQADKHPVEHLAASQDALH